MIHYAAHTVWYFVCLLWVFSEVWQALGGHTVGPRYKHKPHTFGLRRAHLPTCMGRFNPVRKMIQARLCPFRRSTLFDTNFSLKSPKITIITCLLVLSRILSLRVFVVPSVPSNKVHPITRQGKHRGEDLWHQRIRNLGDRWFWVVITTLRPLNPRKDSTNCTGGWVVLGIGLGGYGKFWLHRDYIPGPSSL
jgi:hypothetical protein